MRSISRSRSLSRVSLFVCLLLHFSSALPQARVSAEPRTPSHARRTAPKTAASAVRGAMPASQGVAQVSPTSLSFGNQLVGTTSSTTPTVTLTNIGSGPLGSITITSNNTDYAITSNNCPASLPVGPPGCTFTVSFTPSIQVPDTGAIVITDDAAVGTTLVPLSGTGVGPVSLTPFETFFGSAEAPIPQGTPNGPQTVTLSNQSGGAITVNGISLVGNAAGDFSQTNSNCPTATAPLANGSTCTIPVTFTPRAPGPRTADVSVASSTTGLTYTSHLIGNATILQLPGFTTNQLAANDDGSTGAITLPFDVNFFGTTYSTTYVNNNGNITFTGPFGTYTPEGLTTDIGFPIIAPFFADVYTLTPGSGLVTYGTDTVNGHQAFGVDWQDVAYYAEDTPTLLNSFQLIVIDRSDTGAGNFDMEFNYDKVQWETGTASGGSGGLGGTSAAVGYSNGTGDAGTFFQLNGSLVNGALLDTNTSTGLIYNSLPAPSTTAVPGQYVFQVRNGAVQDADLALTMSQSANPVAPSQQEIYTLTVTNAGPVDATGVVLSDTLPTNATLSSSTGGTCTGTTTLTCSLGTIAANSTGVVVTITVAVNANATGTVVNNASVTSNVPDTNPANNSASATATLTTTPTLTSANPAMGQQGTQNLSIAITGLNTHFAQGTTVLSFTGTGITVASLTVSSATSAMAVLTISATAAVGARDLTMTTGAEVATLSEGFLVTAAATPTIVSVNPATGQQGQQGLSLAITGQNTHFVQGTTVASFGPGIGVASLTVNSATSATAVLNIDAAAALGARTVTMTTGTEVATLTNGFLVAAVGAATLTQVNPNAGLVGQQNLSVVITGQNTHFVQGSSFASFGAGITVVSVTVGSPTSATAVLNISATAALGARNIFIDTGSEVAALASGFTVAPFVVTIAPGTTTPNVPPGGSLAVGLILTGGPTFSGTVTLTCTSADTSITCTIQPGSITLTGNGTTQVAIVVNTYCTANVPALGPSPGGMEGPFGLILLALMLGGGVWMNRRRPRWAMSFAMLMLVVFAGAACNSLPKSPSGAATQPGLKNIVVHAQAGGNVQNIPIQFNVE